MKKVKIMLTAVTVLAIVGGALAFKVKKSADKCVYVGSTTGGNPKIGICTATLGVVDFETFTTTPATNVFVTTRTPAAGQTPCPLTVNQQPFLDCTVNQTYTIEQ
jgi:hypothetical protein